MQYPHRRLSDQARRRRAACFATVGLWRVATSHVMSTRRPRTAAAQTTLIDHPRVHRLFAPFRLAIQHDDVDAPVAGPAALGGIRRAWLELRYPATESRSGARPPTVANTSITAVARAVDRSQLD